MQSELAVAAIQYCGDSTSSPPFGFERLQSAKVCLKCLPSMQDFYLDDRRGVDVSAKVEIYNLINRLTAAGAGVIMISSELPELLGMSDRIVVMYRGRIQAEVESATATQERLLGAALGLAS